MQSAHQNSSEKLENSRLFDSFLKEGAVLQTGSDSYKLFLGPFADSTASDCMQDLLYKPDFWDFTKKQSSGLSLLKAYKIVDLNRQEFVELVSEASSGEINSQIEWLPADKSAFQIQFDWLKTKIKESKISKGLPITEQIGN